MLRKLIFLLTVLAVLLTACGAQGTPTLSPEESSGTAVAMASTIIAQTQAAMPTNTPIPPTETPSPTPLPTFTLEPLPTIEILPTATTAPQGNCEGPLNVGEAGPQSNIRVENETGGSVTFSLWLGEGANAFGQCGFMPGLSPLAKNEKRVISIPKGNFFFSFYGDKAGSGACYVDNRVGDNHLFVVKVKKDLCVVP